jgi:hypothetical protein|tara:strand:- start:174 stop:605 length:432 start_codon:yes stop_codon:yes gene_type:complete
MPDYKNNMKEKLAKILMQPSSMMREPTLGMDANQLDMVEPEYINRVQNPDRYPFITNKDGTRSTHRMAAEKDENGNWFVFPTIVQLPDGQLHEFNDNIEAMRFNIKSGNYKKMPNKETALKYAEGKYKKGTPLAPYKRSYGDN